MWSSKLAVKKNDEWSCNGIVGECSVGYTGNLLSLVLSKEAVDIVETTI